jgi:GNAT superfamily N-acetyltransferase
MTRAHAQAEKASFVGATWRFDVSAQQQESLAMTGTAHATTPLRQPAGQAGDLRLRRLTAGDVPAIATHLLALDMVSRNSRFHCALADAAVARYAQCFDDAADVLFGAVEAGSGRIVALAEARAAAAPRTVDLAVSVDATHRRRGLGRALLACAVSAAFDQGVTEARLRFGPGNLPAARIAAGLGARFGAPGRAILLA